MDEQGAALLAGGTIIFTIVIIVFSLVVTIIPIVLVIRWLLIVNDAPQLNLVVEVHPMQSPGYRGEAAPTDSQGGNAPVLPAPAPFTAYVQAFVPVFAMASIQPGAMVPVRFDPMNPTRIAIDFRAMGFA